MAVSVSSLLSGLPLVGGPCWESRLEGRATGEQWRGADEIAGPLILPNIWNSICCSPKCTNLEGQYEHRILPTEAWGKRSST